ncbi:Sodium/calcium exchanger membrane region [Metarhizium album ARSEF 1941]|uniref:Sodium/calcium exchanger membrane region n=1 Tax=Metarhizium album (strain ARSEF 1941) TaxID=1081103 RepID=A0A0B2WZN4_METAS|nr:Sodium/calcium exchanger membrane region [Metarhizium album ARSEF 1941]KHN98892.1 Sodium/calcium exchanger membrane region [Metarhizium album ARSEF 1941]
MTQSSSDPPDIDNNGPGAPAKAHGVFDDLPNRQHTTATDANSPPLVASSSIAKASEPTTAPPGHSQNNGNSSCHLGNPLAFREKAQPPESDASYFGPSAKNIAPATSTQADAEGSVVEPEQGRIDLDTTNKSQSVDSNTGDDGTPTRRKRTFVQELRRSFWLVASYSWLNILLVFVPVGIVVANIHGVHGGIVFAMNCIAVIPLAGLLSHATESVASNMGDSLGALLNVTFGNAVELIIFIIALVKNQIRIVQASLLGSILANLLLILGMGFFLGGLRFREQTAFHASFNDDKLADAQSLKISRGTSVILLLVYIIYLLFQLKSHAYMYESTPQHIVDAESTPGPAAAWLDTSSSSDDDSSSSSDSVSSGHSRGTIGRKMKKVLRSGMRRKPSFASTDTADARAVRGGSVVTGNPSPNEEATSEASSSRKPYFPRMPSTDDGHSTDDEKVDRHRKHRKRRHSRRKQSRRHGRKHDDDAKQEATSVLPENGVPAGGQSEPRRVDFALPAQLDAPTGVAAESGNESSNTKRPFQGFRSLSVKNLTPSVFVQNPRTLVDASPPPAGPVPRVRYGIRRTNSLPDRLSHQQHLRPPGAMLPAQIPLMSLNTAAAASQRLDDDDGEEHLTRWASVILLLVSTGLVAVCAEFLVDSIKEVTETSRVGEIFIGLIILPIVGNAAEHVTAVTVAMKNKMDLAIGVAVGSSIQIALFVTPLVVILGWIMDKEMTLYFTLFETVCLFVSAFIVNFLVLDGRSNYLEGALLCAVYIIIAVVAFFYPDPKDANSWSD